MAGRIDFFNNTYREARRRVVTKAASYTVTPDDNGSVFVATSTATFTLPAVADSKGLEYMFIAKAAMTVAAPTDTLVAFNDATATSIAFTTASEIIGGAVHVICDGSLWYAFVHLGAETQTPTIA